MLVAKPKVIAWQIFIPLKCLRHSVNISELHRLDEQARAWFRKFAITLCIGFAVIFSNEVNTELFSGTVVGSHLRKGWMPFGPLLLQCLPLYW